MKKIMFGAGVVTGIVIHILWIGLSLPYNKHLREDLKKAIAIAEE